MNGLRSIAAVIFWVSSFMQAFAQAPSGEQLAVPLTSPGKPYALSVNLMAGSVKISSYSGKDVIVQVEDSKPAQKGAKSRRISDYGIVAKENNNTVTVYNTDMEKAVSLVLKIPQDVKLVVNTASNGNIEVDNVRGAFEINNANGPVTLNNIAGSVVANTTEGNIRVKFSAVNAKAAMAFSTLTGDVDVTFPAPVAADFLVRSDEGNVYCDFNIDVSKSEPKVTRITEGGRYKLKVDGWIKGRINGGGPEIMMKNMSGNIYIRKSG